LLPRLPTILSDQNEKVCPTLSGKWIKQRLCFTPNLLPHSTAHFMLILTTPFAYATNPAPIAQHALFLVPKDWIVLCPYTALAMTCTSTASTFGDMATCFPTHLFTSYVMVIVSPSVTIGQQAISQLA
jgi:hypothetical protein